MNPAHTQAIIDLGTNTILMVVGRLQADGKTEILADLHAIARLGKGVDAKGHILPETLERVGEFFQDYKKRALSLGADQISAFGTSALRDAANREDFIASIKRLSGIEVFTLSGREEARLTFAGAGFGIELPKCYCVLDIGGGSTELAYGSHGHVQQLASVDLGALRITERHFDRLPPSSAQLEAARATIREQLGKLFTYPAGVALVGVAGTATTIGALASGVEDFNAASLNGHILPQSKVAEITAYLATLELERIRAIRQIHPQRADIITAGALILSTALDLFQCSELIVSTRGIRYGLLARALKRS
ncbi:MAG: hypothetical protein CME16_05940 [Gemmatimonadetes bacterium]|nr:hypothetical protein [Gemmatimonadota bacterium]